MIGASRALFLALLVAAACGCGESVAPLQPFPACEEVRWPAASPDLSVIVVLNDTLRRDRLGAYGGPASSPNFDRLAEHAQTFDAAQTQAPWTKPSIGTLFTSLYPSQHGLLTHPGAQFLANQEVAEIRESDVLPDDVTTLAETFRTAGFRTGAFVSNPWLDRRFGLGQGFEVYEDSFGRFDAPGQLVTQGALEWLDQLPSHERFLLYLHYVDTHRPYPPLSWDAVKGRASELRDAAKAPSPAARQEIQDQVRFEANAPPAASLVEPTPALLQLAYDAGVSAFDAVLGELLVELDARDLGPVLLIVTSDHGEAIFEHGLSNHGRSLFEEETAIPLLIRGPGLDATRIACPVGLIDLMPTLCSYLGLTCPETMAGHSFLTADRGGDRYSVTEGVIGKPEHRSIRDARFKLIHEPGYDWKSAEHSGSWSLFDLQTDPDERENLLDTDPPPAWFPALKESLSEAVPRSNALTPQRTPIGAELEERLEALGYIESAPGENPED